MAIETRSSQARRYDINDRRHPDHPDHVVIEHEPEPSGASHNPANSQDLRDRLTHNQQQRERERRAQDKRPSADIAPRPPLHPTPMAPVQPSASIAAPL